MLGLVWASDGRGPARIPTSARSGADDAGIGPRARLQGVTVVKGDDKLAHAIAAQTPVVALAVHLRLSAIWTDLNIVNAIEHCVRMAEQLDFPYQTSVLVALLRICRLLRNSTGLLRISVMSQFENYVFARNRRSALQSVSAISAPFIVDIANSTSSPVLWLTQRTLPSPMAKKQPPGCALAAPWPAPTVPNSGPSFIP